MDGDALRPFGGLLDTVRTGRCAATEFYGQPFFSWLSDQPEQIARFSGAMASLTDGIKLGAISSFDFTGAGRIVDVGGADGAVLAHVLAAAPEATGVVFDLPHVVAEAGPRLAGYGLGDRLTAAAGEASRLLASIRAAAHMAKMIDLTMLGMLSGRERTQAEYRLLLEQAGFAFDAVTATPTPISIVRARA